MKTAYVEPKLRASELEIENARLQRLVAELIARNQQLRQALESATRQDPDLLYPALDTTARAAFFKESKLHRKSGGPVGVEAR